MQVIESIENLNKAYFTKIHVFKFSKREKTKAFEMAKNFKIIQDSRNKVYKIHDMGNNANEFPSLVHIILHFMKFPIVGSKYLIKPLKVLKDLYE